MCYMIAIPIAMAAMTAATTAYQTIEQNKAQNRAIDAQLKQQESNMQAGQVALQEQNQQIADKAAVERQKRQAEALRERSRLRVESGGLVGNSIDAIFNASRFNENQDLSVINQNEENEHAQNAREYERLSGNYANQTASLKSQYKRGGATGLEAALAGAVGGLQMYGSVSSAFGDAGLLKQSSQATSNATKAGDTLTKQKNLMIKSSPIASNFKSNWG
ncbi:virion core protein, T7 gp14 family [Campylobacter concisus]